MTSLGGRRSLGTYPGPFSPPLLCWPYGDEQLCLPTPFCCELWPWETMSQHKPLLPLHCFLRYLSQWQEGEEKQKNKTLTQLCPSACCMSTHPPWTQLAAGLEATPSEAEAAALRLPYWQWWPSMCSWFTALLCGAGCNTRPPVVLRGSGGL